MRERSPLRGQGDEGGSSQAPVENAAGARGAGVEPRFAVGSPSSGTSAPRLLDRVREADLNGFVSNDGTQGASVVGGTALGRNRCDGLPCAATRRTFVLPHVLETVGTIAGGSGNTFDTTIFITYRGGLAGSPTSGGSVTVDFFLFDDATGNVAVSRTGALGGLRRSRLDAEGPARTRRVQERDQPKRRCGEVRAALKRKQSYRSTAVAEREGAAILAAPEASGRDLDDGR